MLASGTCVRLALAGEVCTILEIPMFNALVVEKTESGTQADLRQISYDDLPAIDVTVAVDYSTVNYKYGLCIGPGGGLVRAYSYVL